MSHQNGIIGMHQLECSTDHKFQIFKMLGVKSYSYGLLL